MMKKWLIIVLALALLTPWSHVAVDDGGTEIYTAASYQVTLKHTMHWEGDTFGYLTGTKVRVLFFEIYNDICFVPALASLAAESLDAESAAEMVRGCPRKAIIREWGKPDSVLSGFYGEKWKITDNKSVVVYYDDKSLVQDIIWT